MDSRKKKYQAERRTVIHQQARSETYNESGSAIHQVVELYSVTYVDNQLNANPHITSTITSPSPRTNANSTLDKRPQQIFSNKQERELSGFVRDASEYYNGLTTKDVRILAFVYGVCNQVDLPADWHDKHQASLAWCSRFAKRYKLSLLIAGNSS